MLRATQMRAPVVDDQLTENAVQQGAADGSTVDMQTFSSLVTTQLAYYGNSPGWTQPPTPRVGGAQALVPDFNVPLIGAKNGSNLIYTTPAFFLPQTLCLFFNGLPWFPGMGNDYLPGEGGGVGTGYNQVILLDPVRAPRASDNIWVNYFRA